MPGVDTSGFPQDDDVIRMLYWMGSDYIETLVSELHKGLLKQDAGSQIVSVHCSGKPDFQTAFKLKQGTESTGVATRMDAVFPIEVVTIDSKQRKWRLFMSVEYHATALDTPDSLQVKCDYNILRADPA
ncbi:MAG: hypothetical protein ACRYFS_12605 [Janthinobacterium lividum]